MIRVQTKTARTIADESRRDAETGRADTRTAIGADAPERMM